MQYPVTLLTGAALIDGLTFALARQFKTEAEANICKCEALSKPAVSEYDIEITWRIYHFEAIKAVKDEVIQDIRDVLHLSDVRRIVLVSMLAYGMICRRN